MAALPPTPVRPVAEGEVDLAEHGRVGGSTEKVKSDPNTVKLRMVVLVRVNHLGGLHLREPPS
jgi:hypothetical protein